MDRQYEPIRRFLQRVRARLRALSALDAAARAALALSAVVAVALGVWSLASLGGRSPIALASLLGVVLVLAASALVWGLLPLRGRPTDAQVARFIEERVPALGDRLATAVDIVRRDTPSLLVGPLVEDAARRVDAIDVDEVVPGRRIRAGGFKAGAAAIALLVLAAMAREPARQSLDAASLALFPERVRLEIVPGHARVLQGAPLTIQARLIGNRAPVGARLEVGAGDLWRGTEMQAESGGGFRLAMPPAAADFQYRVVAGSITSPVYRVTVAHPPRVTRIDVDYAYPPALGLPPRTEMDSGDVYAPAGTDVTLHVHTDRPMASGQLSLADGRLIALSAGSPAQLTAAMKVVEDGAYRIALRDLDGLSDPGQTEYFIRAIEDRPPDVHVVKPASDRSVTRLEEVEIEAQADDDYGIERMELVYAVRGQSEHVIPLDVPRRGTSVTARHTLYLEDLDVRPGDFVSYYVRARDITRGTRSNEGRSDIFFLEVRPFEQEFALAQSQSMAGGGYNGSIDDLVNAQKQVVVATWKLDRRSQNARGAQSPADIRAVSRTEADLKTRTEETASSFRESAMRDPRRRLQGRGDAAGQAMPEEDAMTAAVEAMGRAVVSLDALKTAAALPAEMQALNSLLAAQALVKKRQVSTQQSAQGGPGNNNRNYDVSALFDKELQRLQETRYETRQPSGQSREDRDALEKIAELARRQDEMLKRQQDLARQRMDDAEMARQLEKLTREQAELRQQAEELARRMSKLESGQQNAAGAPSGSSSGSEQTARQLRDISNDMRSATNDLRRRDSAQAGAGGSRALEKLKSLEQQLRAGSEGRQKKPGDPQRDASGSDNRRDAESRALSEQRGRAQQLRQNIERVTRELEKLGQQESGRNTPNGQKAPNQTGKTDERREPGPGGRGDEITRLREQAARELERTRALLDELRRQDPSFASGGAGFTFEGAGMVFSSPGTEAFKQDLARWEALSAEATRALDRAESSLSNRLQEQDTTGRLAAGVSDKAPAAYQQQVDRYFKALGNRKQP
jgi:hypothetical protein